MPGHTVLVRHVLRESTLFIKTSLLFKYNAKSQLYASINVDIIHCSHKQSSYLASKSVQRKF